MPKAMRLDRLTEPEYDAIIAAVAYYETVLEDEGSYEPVGVARRTRRAMERAQGKITATMGPPSTRAARHA